MKSVSAKTNVFFSNFVLLLVVAVCALGLGLAIQAAAQSVRFARGTDQVLWLISTSRNGIGRDRNIPIGDDLLLRLYHMQHLAQVDTSVSPVQIVNPWDGRVSVTLAAPQQIRIESAVPTFICRQMIDFFGKNMQNPKLARVEAKDLGTTAWRQVFVASVKAESRSITPSLIEAGCGQSLNSVVALTFSLG